jgi:hypothetical protein
MPTSATPGRYRRDRHSLSYIAEPRPGLWLDRHRHAAVMPIKAVASAAMPAGIAAGHAGLAVPSRCSRARADSKLVLAMMHHGALEHFLTGGQGAHFPDLLIADWNMTSLRRLAEMGLRLVFTGHGHAHDIRRDGLGRLTLTLDGCRDQFIWSPIPIPIAGLN